VTSSYATPTSVTQKKPWIVNVVKASKACGERSGLFFVRSFRLFKHNGKKHNDLDQHDVTNSVEIPSLSESQSVRTTGCHQFCTNC